MEKASPALQVRTPSAQTPPQSAEPTEQLDDTMDFAVNEGHGVAEESVMVPAEEQKELDLLEKFLPPPPKEKCSDELQVSVVTVVFFKWILEICFHKMYMHYSEVSEFSLIDVES